MSVSGRLIGKIATGSRFSFIFEKDESCMLLLYQLVKKKHDYKPPPLNICENIVRLASKENNFLDSNNNHFVEINLRHSGNF